MKLLILIVLIMSVIILTYLGMIMPGHRSAECWLPFKEYLYANRGLFNNSSEAPENSEAAFRKAVNRGYGIELDVQLTKDHRVVVFHDFTASRILRDSSGRPVPGKIRDYTLAQLKEFTLLGSSERIPLFADVLKLVNGRVPLIVEMKIDHLDWRARVCPKADQLLRDYKGKYIVESFHPCGVFWYRRNRPDILRGQLSDKFIKDRSNPKRHFILYFMMEYLLFNFLTRPDFIAYNRKYKSNLSRRLCRGLYKNTAAAWTVRSQKQLLQARKDFDLYIFDSFIPEEHI